MSLFDMKRHMFRSEAGFTIVELMIATAVFSIVMILLVIGVIQITRDYYKGVVESNTQNVARNIVSTVGQAIEFSGQLPTLPPASNGSPATLYFCIGNSQYAYITGYQQSDNPNASLHQLTNVFVVSSSSCPTSPVPDFFANRIPAGQELISPHMRLAKLTVQEVTTDLFQIDARVVYGDDDLLCSPSNNDCSFSTTSAHLDASDLACKPQAGSQFCATSELNSLVKRRLF